MISSFMIAPQKKKKPVFPMVYPFSVSSKAIIVPANGLVWI